MILPRIAITSAEAHPAKLMSYAPFHPTRHYVNQFLLGMVEAERWSCSVLATETLRPLNEGVPPTFAHFRNRLKIMANLDPIRYSQPRAGTFEIAILSRRLNGEWFDCHYTFQILFRDSDEVASIQLSADLTKQVPGVDPDLMLM